MAVTEQSYTGNGSTTNYSFTFPYLKSTDILVQVDAAVTTAWSLANATTVQFNSAPANGAAIKILRDTNVDNLTATFYAGSALKSEDLNDNFNQNLYVTQEIGNRSFENTGTSTMIGNLNMGEDTVIKFEGATDNAHETTLTVVDPTADRTITLPNVTGTVVTTGDTGTVATGMIANDAINADKIANDAINADKIADDVVNSEHYAADSIDTEHYAAGSVDATALASNAVTTVKINADAVTGAKIADDSIDSEHYAADSIDTEHYAPASIDAAALATGAVETAKIAADAVNGSKIADDAIDSEHYTDGSIDTVHIGSNQITAALIANATITDTQLASNAVTTSQITDDAVNTDKIADNAILIAQIGCEETTLTNDDTKVPTSGAVVDYVAAQIAPIGGLEVIADEDNFPAIPASGVVISIADAAGIVVNGSGTSTTARTAGNGSDNVTINNFPSSLYSETLASGVGLMVTSTGSSNTYNYHKLLAAETDVKQLSDDINDFNARYRVNAGEPGSNNDEGDLVYDTNADKMKVYDSSTSAWKEVTSTGDFKFLVPVDAGTTTAATWDGSDTSFDLKEATNSGSAASVTNVNQLMVVLNGVVQKPNAGSWSGSGEGFYLTDADTIRFATAPPSGSTAFIVQSGSAVSIPTPGNGTVTAAKIASGAVETAKIANDAIDGTKIADDAIAAEHIADNAVGLAALAGIARGKIIYGDASGNPAVLAPGTSGQVLESDGTDISWQNAAAGATGGNTNLNGVFWENQQTVTHDYTIQNNYNAGSFGPITINSGITVTVGAGESWTVI